MQTGLTNESSDTSTGMSYQPFVPQPESSFTQPSALENFQEQMREVQARFRSQRAQRERQEMERTQILYDNARLIAQQDLINVAEMRSLSILEQPAQLTPISDTQSALMRNLIARMNRRSPQEPRAI